MLKAFWRDDSGATSIEYAFIAGFISILIVGAARSIGVKLNTLYFQPVAGNLT